MTTSGDSRQQNFYDDLAPYYREFCLTRSDYLAAVDRLVIEGISPVAVSLLDVGAADGIRAERIVEALGIPVLVLMEPGVVLAGYCEQRKDAEIWRGRIEELNESDRRFDVIICLWNVLGHISNSVNRLAALRKMRSLLTDDGQIFLDVNNRYNARAYGWTMTLGRVLYDAMAWSDENGDVEFDLRITDKVIEGSGHVFTPKEISRLIKQSGLRITRRLIVDYETGERRRFEVEGQLFFELCAGD